MRWMTFGLLVLSAAGCAGQQGELVWHKDGAAAGEYEAAAYECERDTRMVSPTFSRGVLIPAIEAQDFATRCMNAKGFYLVTASTLSPTGATTYSRGKAYGVDERVTCQRRDGSQVGDLAGPCVNGGGTILGRAT